MVTWKNRYTDRSFKSEELRKKENLMNEKLLNLVCDTKFIYQLCVVREDKKKKFMFIYFQ